MNDRRLTILVMVFFAVTALAAIVAIYAWRGEGAKGIARIGGPFALVDQNGETRTDGDFRGRYMLIYFGYAFCPDICPTALSDMLIALNEIGPAGKDVQPIFITVDPARDTPQALKSYVANFDPRLIALTGTPAQITAVAKAYRVYYAKVENEERPESYYMDHSSIIYLMDPDGRYVTHFNHNTAPAAMTERLRAAVS